MDVYPISSAIFNKDAKFHITGNNWYARRADKPDIEWFEQNLTWVPSQFTASAFTLKEISTIVPYMRNKYKKTVNLKVNEI